MSACSCCGCGEAPRAGTSAVKRVMLAGNPNCGKSTLFNRLCNLHVRTGNYPGVTVSRHTGSYGANVRIVDLPGTYSLNSATADERVACAELLSGSADLIVNVIDATTLERSLYLTTELRMLGIPMAVVLNMWDEARKRRIGIDPGKLAASLGCPVVPVSAATGEGLDALGELLRASAWQQCPPEYLGGAAVAAEFAKIVAAAPEPFKEKALFYAKSAVLGDPCPPSLAGHEAFAAAVSAARPRITGDRDTVYQAISEDRYAKIGEMVRGCAAASPEAAAETRPEGSRLTRLVDGVVLNRFLAFPVFLAVMCAVYYISVTWLGSIVTDWANDVLFGEEIIPAVKERVAALGAPDWLTALTGDGVVGGVGAVLGFVPQMIILFLLLSLLEECGYMTRAAFILDRVFNLIGLSGRAFIPYLIGSGCGVPALMTSRTLGSESERRISLFTATMIPCGAKLPVIIVFAGAVFADIPFFAPGMYLMSILMVVISASVLRKFAPFKPSVAPLMLELPAYRVPMLRAVALSVWHRVEGYITKAGRIIFPCVTALWLLSHVGYDAESRGFVMLEDEEAGSSLIADAVRPVSGIFAPVGFDDYRATVSVVTGLLAKEAIVSAMAVFSGAEEPEEAEEGASAEEIRAADDSRNAFYGALRNAMFHIDEKGVVGILAALSFVIFNLFTIPCVAAVGVLRKEIGSARLFWTAVAYQLGLSYAAALVVYQIGLVATGAGAFGPWTAAAIACLAVLAWILFIKKPAETEEAIAFELINN